MFEILLLAGLVSPFLPAPVLYFLKLKRYKNSGYTLLFVLAFQVAVMITLWQIFIAGIPSAAAIIMPGVLAIYWGINFIIGILLCPIFFFACARPDKWKKKIFITLSVYSFLLVVIFMPTILTKAGLRTNVDFHGRVTNIDGSPVHNAAVYFTNCPYIKENPAITDEHGFFEVKASCQSYFMVTKIYNPETNSDCQSRFSRQRERGSYLVVFDSFDVEDNPAGRPHWKNYGGANPFIFACMWDQPENLLKKSGHFRVEDRDGKYRINLHADRHKDLLGDSGEIEIEYDSLEKLFIVKAVDGGVQETSRKAYIDVAPTDGYKAQVEYRVTDLTQGYNPQNLFFNIKNTYGYLELSQHLRGDKIQFEIYFIFNPDGGINLITHEDNYESIR